MRTLKGGDEWASKPEKGGAKKVDKPGAGGKRPLTTTGFVGAGMAVLGFLTPGVPGYVRLALVGYVALVLSLSTTVWDGDVAWLRAATALPVTWERIA